MDLVGPIIEIVKLVGGPIVRYLKYQIKFNGYLKKFKESKEGLCSRKHEIESRQETQLQSTPYHVEKAEVAKWLKDVEEFIKRQDVDDEVNSWGFLSCCCRAVILEERIQELKEIYDRGDKYTNECLVIEDHFKKINYYVKIFKQLKEKLQRKQGDIGSTLHSQLVHGKIKMEQVKHWLEKVEEITGPIARDIEDKIDKGGYLSNVSDPLTMLLREKIEEMEEICDEGSRLPECLVIDDPLALAIELSASELQGSEAVKAKILAHLKGEEVTKLGVWGMGGVGKTTIMMHVHNELLKEGKFMNIIWANVSQNFDIYNLQEQIACSLKENLEAHQNTVKRAAMLSKLLKEDKHKPYLLILDDVWRSFNLSEVGIPEPNETNGCKLVLTTRSQEITRSMGCRTIKVETLSGEEALKLFLNKVGGTILSDNGGIKNALESTLKGIVDECDGLPLAIVTVASSLKEISEPRLWSAALNQLRECKRNVAGMDDDDAFRIIKFSYDRLKNPKIQYCFLYCALYPEDYNIPKEEIIEYWIDEGFIDGMETRHAMKDEGYDILRKLEDNCLLESREDINGVEFVRMHDLIRDMALDITRTSPRFFVEAGKALTEQPEKLKCIEDVEKVSLMLNWIKEIPSTMASSTCRRLTTLLLPHNHLSIVPEFVFEHMPELKILDLSFNEELRSLPNSISKLVNLTTLLLEWTSLENVPSLSALGSLKKLNLRGTKIKEVPEGLGMLMNLKCLFLCGLNCYNFLEVDEMPDGILLNLSKLEEFFVDCTRIKLKGEVIGRLMKLEVLHGWFPNVTDLSIFLKCQPSRLTRYFITVGSNLESKDTLMIDDAIEMLPRYKKIMVFKETSIVGENMLLLLPSVQVLCIEACHNIRSLNDFSGIKAATDLRRCWIYGCKGMEYILSLWINPIVQTLECLCLCDLDNLDGLFEAEVIAKSPPPPRAFSSLKEVRIESCQKIKKLFPSWKLVEYLQSLEVIHVRECEEMEEIIASDSEEGEEGEEGGDIINLILPKLKRLELWELPALKSICRRRAIIVCDSLEYTKVWGCKGLRRIFLYLPSPPYLFVSDLDKLDGLFEAEVIAKSLPPLSTFPSLKRVNIVDCRKIKKLFPSWNLVEYLQSLEEIDVRHCEEMEEIIASDHPEEEGEEGRDIINLILPKLKSLTLISLPALKSICSRKAVIVCDSLERIEIWDCEGLRRIPIYLPLLDNAQPSPPPSLQQIIVTSKEWWESLEWDHLNAKDVLRSLLDF